MDGENWSASRKRQREGEREKRIKKVHDEERKFGAKYTHKDKNEEKEKNEDKDKNQSGEKDKN